MTRDKALAIADRIMARVGIDRAIHRDAIADEVIAAMAVQEAQPAPPPAAKNFTPTVMCDDGWFRWDGSKWLKILG